MAFDGNGNYVRIHNWTFDAANGLDINAGEMDAEDNSISGAFSLCVTRDGQGKMAADLLPATDNVFNLGTTSKRWLTFNGISFSAFVNYPQTAGEASAGVTPVSLINPNSTVIGGGIVNRYGINTTPGTTDMSTAFASAAASQNVFAIPPGSYLTNTALSGTYGYIAEGNPTFSGTNPVGAWIPAFGGSLQVVQTGTFNSLVCAQLNNLAPNSVSEPCALTAYGRNNNAGNIVFGVFGRADQYAATGVATNEINSFNWSGIASTASLPPSRGFATTQNVTVAWTVAAGGNALNSIGIQITPEGSAPQQFQAGIYINWQTCTQYGIFIDSLLNDTFTPAYIKGSANGFGLRVQSVGDLFGVAITGTGGQFSCAATNISVGMQVTISGALGGTGTITGYTNPTTYVISATNGSTTFTLQTLIGGAIVTTAGTPTGLTYRAVLKGGAGILYTDSNGVDQFKVAQSGFVSIGGTQVLSSQVTGYGTPTGGSHQASFAAGAITLPNLAAAVAQLIVDLKTHGMVGA